MGLYERGVPIDVTNLGMDLHKSGKLESVDGLSYLLDLADGAGRRPGVV